MSFLKSFSRSGNAANGFALIEAAKLGAVAGEALLAGGLVGNEGIYSLKGLEGEG